MCGGYDRHTHCASQRRADENAPGCGCEHSLIDNDALACMVGMTETQTAHRKGVLTKMLKDAGVNTKAPLPAGAEKPSGGCALM